jgi:hypothetical protein
MARQRKARAPEDFDYVSEKDEGSFGEALRARRRNWRELLDTLRSDET